MDTSAQIAFMETAIGLTEKTIATFKSVLLLANGHVKESQVAQTVTYLTTKMIDQVAILKDTMFTDRFETETDNFLAVLVESMDPIDNINTILAV